MAKRSTPGLPMTGRELLFDLTEDPRELNDLSRARPDRLAWWRDQLIEELTGRPEGFVQNGKLAPGQPIQGLLPHVGKGVPQRRDLSRGISPWHFTNPLPKKNYRRFSKIFTKTARPSSEMSYPEKNASKFADASIRSSQNPISPKCET